MRRPAGLLALSLLLAYVSFRGEFGRINIYYCQASDSTVLPKIVAMKIFEYDA